MSTRGCAKGAHHSDDWAATAATDFQNKNSLSGLKAANEESMYNLTIHFGPNAVAWSFLFKDKNRAEYALSKAMAPGEAFYILEDDYGQKAHINPKQIHGVLLEDTELGEESRIIRGLVNAKGQARANKRAANDPELKMLAQEQNRGPSVITPFTNGGFRQ